MLRRDKQTRQNIKLPGYPSFGRNSIETDPIDVFTNASSRLSGRLLLEQTLQTLRTTLRLFIVDAHVLETRKLYLIRICGDIRHCEHSSRINEQPILCLTSHAKSAYFDDSLVHWPSLRSASENRNVY